MPCFRTVTNTCIQYTCVNIHAQNFWTFFFENVASQYNKQIFKQFRVSAATIPVLAQSSKIKVDIDGQNAAFSPFNATGE